MNHKVKFITGCDCYRYEVIDMPNGIPDFINVPIIPDLTTRKELNVPSNNIREFTFMRMESTTIELVYRERVR